MEKICCKCKLKKPFDQFWKDKTKKHGRDTRCIECNGGNLIPKPPSGHLRCSLCKEMKLLKEMTKNKNSSSGYTNKCRKCDILRDHLRRKKVREKVLNFYGNKCACCNESISQFLTIDHINGNGNKHLKEVKKRTLYSWLLKNNFPDGYQILCYNCNCAKGHYGVCPHQSKEV